MKFFFGIPLRSKETSTDWDVVCKCIYATVQSMRNNILPIGCSLEILICGHEKPSFIINNNYKEVTFIESDINIPSSSNEYMLDKSRKKKILAKHVDSILENGEDALFMFFDADDLISKEFMINIVRDFRTSNIDDIAFMRGYILDLANNDFAFFNGYDRRFFKICGSSYISKVTGGKAFEYLNKLNNHTKFPEISESLGRVVEYSRYPGVGYVVNHGANDVNQRIGDAPINRLVKRYSIDIETHKYIIINFGIHI